MERRTKELSVSSIKDGDDLEDRADGLGQIKEERNVLYASRKLLEELLSLKTIVKSIAANQDLLT